MQTFAAIMESSMEKSQKIKNDTVIWHHDSTSGYTSKETQNTNSKEYTYHYVHCSIIYYNQDMEPKVAITRQVDKKVVVQISLS